jgi:S-methylmethionine-dependent homocysteine/selenocysteine methylase
LAKKAVEESNRPVFIVGSIGPFATYFCDGSEYSGAYMNDLNFNRDVLNYTILKSKYVILVDKDIL